MPSYRSPGRRTNARIGSKNVHEDLNKEQNKQKRNNPPTMASVMNSELALFYSYFPTTIINPGKSFMI